MRRIANMPIGKLPEATHRSALGKVRRSAAETRSIAQTLAIARHGVRPVLKAQAGRDTGAQPAVAALVRDWPTAYSVPNIW